MERPLRARRVTICREIAPLLTTAQIRQYYKHFLGAAAGDKTNQASVTRQTQREAHAE